MMVIKKKAKKRLMMDMMKFVMAAVVVSIVCVAALGQEEQSQAPNCLVLTNLNDQLKTEVTIDGAAGIDIDKLNLDSVHADEHKTAHTAVRNLAVADLRPYSVLMAKPLLLKDRSGKTARVDGMFINTDALRKSSQKNVLVDGLATKNLLVQDLSPLQLYLDNENQVSKIEIQQFSLADLIGISNIATSVVVIDNSTWHVGTSRYNVEVSDATYADLAEMKLIYDFEQSYNESIKSEVKLNDVKKLERQQYIRWIQILAANKKCSIELIENTTPRKIIGEAWIHDGNYSDSVKDNMLKNLNWLKSRGYDTVLVRFRCSEDLSQLKQMISDIKDAGFDVFSTFVGIDYESPRWTPFINPETIERYISEIAPMCSGYLLNWRSTSNHVKIIPIEYFNYLCRLLRKANDKILIYGEVYYGNIDPLRMRTLIYTAPENVTGVLINNMGYYGYNITYVVNNLFATSVPKYRKMDKLGQVIGIAPYYCSREATKIRGLTLEKEYGYKAKVEKAFARTGYGTITMLHDGVDDNETRLIAKPGSSKWTDTTDNILYDTKIQEILEEESTSTR